MAEATFEALRHEMVRIQIERRGVCDPAVLQVMGRVPRHLFVPGELRGRAYDDCALPIGFGQTISQPYIVALMLELGRPSRAARALDVGTGCGYQAALLADIVPEVFGMELLPELAERAQKHLSDLGYTNVSVSCGDGYKGLPDKAPFDLILVACAPSTTPPALVEQLAPGGRLVLPVGEGFQDLICIEKDPDGQTHRTRECAVAFVPMLHGDEEAG